MPRRRRVTLETYHGQVAALGYANVATCSDCHGTHDILPARNPASSVAPANLLKTCQNCHADATAGFATFQAHATTDDFAHYPYAWIASKFVIAAVGGVLVIFWIHSALWFYRELRDRQQHKLRPHVRAEALPRRRKARRAWLFRALERRCGAGRICCLRSASSCWWRPA